MKNKNLILPALISFFLLFSIISVSAESISYHFDEIEVTYAAEFEAELNEKISSTGAWVDDIVGSDKKITAVYGIVNLLRKNGESLTEEFIKVSGDRVSKRFLLNSGRWEYHQKCFEKCYKDNGKETCTQECENTGKHKKIKSFFWSAKKLIDNSIVKDFTLPIYSVILIRNFDEQGNLESFEWSFSNDGKEHISQFNNNSEQIHYISKSIKEAEKNKLCLVVTSGHELNIGIFGNKGQPRLVNKTTCLKISSEFENEIKNLVCINERGKLENISIKWGDEIIVPSITINCRTDISCGEGDNGKDYSVRGDIWGICYDCPGQAVGGNNDFCVNSSTLAEFYCVDSYGWRREDVNCPYGCDEGACLQSPQLDCNGETVGDRFCSENNSYKICVFENKRFYWREGVCQQGCVNGYCVEETLYQCKGEIVDNLCYNKGYRNPNAGRGLTSSYEDNNIRISFEYPNKTVVGENFSITTTIINKLDKTNTFDYVYSIYDSEKISSDFLINDKTTKTNPIKLSLNPRETKQFTSIVKANNPIMKGGSWKVLIDVQFWFFDGNTSILQVFLKEIEPVENYLKCGMTKYPERIDDTDGYSSAKCCNNVFYPSFTCCADSDCVKGKCVDGLCTEVSPVTPYGRRIDNAKGEKDVLIILLDDPQIVPGGNSGEVCSNKANNYSNFLNSIENYYDSMALTYLNEDSNFINFNWNVYGIFTLNMLDLTESQVMDPSIIVDRAINHCNLGSKYNYEEIMLYLPSTNYSMNWCGGESACAGKPITIKTGKFNVTTIAHEIAHNFGCRDLYTMLAGTYQWQGELMSTGRENIAAEDISLDMLPGLQVCRGEMGWVDIDGDGRVEIYSLNSN